ncbi:MAG TPA: M20/M25/M40 family metallo-hydrolase [Gemmatimonadales bacterium]|nr:M20/M25/M40 family metallo-hydrolase [Gemmatimonadales bacterium]
MLPVRTLAAAVLLALPPWLAAQTPDPGGRVAAAVSGAAIRAHVDFLASDLLEGRAAGTRGGEIAAAYIAAQFARLGLEPAGDSGSYLHRVPVLSLTPEPDLSIGGQRLAYRDDYVLWSMRNEPEVTLAGDLVFVGHGIVAPTWNWDDYAGVDVKGKTVVALVNDPGLRDPRIFKGKALTYYGRWTYKIEEAARQGAAGILLIHTDESATYGWASVTGSWTGPQVRIETPATSLIAAGWLTRSAATRVFAGAGLDLDSLMDRAARRGFRGVPIRGGLRAGVRSRIERSVTANVIARLPGAGSKAHEAVMIGGHYDHLGIRRPVNGDSIANGAVDNATGTAAVLALADAFVASGVRPGRSVLFIAFGAEESGLLGSTAFAERPTIPLRDLAAVLNLDGIAPFGATADIAALGDDQSTLGDAFRAAAAAEGLRASVNADAAAKGYFFRSDHFPMVRAGVPGLSFQDGMELRGKPADTWRRLSDDYTAERYHQPGDEWLDWYTVDPIVQQARVAARIAVAVGDAAGQPEWHAGSEFKAAGQARLLTDN